MKKRNAYWMIRVKIPMHISVHTGIYGDVITFLAPSCKKRNFNYDMGWLFQKKHKYYQHQHIILYQFNQVKLKKIIINA